MATSRRPLRVAVALAALAAGLAACDSLLGLGSYSVVPEAGAYEAGTSEDATDDVFEVGGFDSTTTDGGDGGDAADVTVQDASDAMVTPDVSLDAAPELNTLWARWPMPNPDAAIAPGSDAMLPNQMAYDLGDDGGSATAYDMVTKLTWLRAPGSAQTFAQAASYCVDNNFQLPTRIQLVSLIDFTRQPTIDTAAFPGVSGGNVFWTSSQVATDTGATGQYWTISFGTGLTAGSTSQSATQVLCVQGGP
jgi:hypothetical protein